jgi:hypothetical protein
MGMMLLAAPAMPARAAPNAAVRAAYDHYLAAIAKARQSIEASAGVRKGHEAEDRREGELFLHSIIDASVTMAMIDTPDHPVMALVPRPADRLGFDNPDNLYYAARFDDQGPYVITGKRGLARTFVIQTNRGLPGLTDKKGETLSFLTGHDLHPAADGSFSITLSREKPATGDWLPLLPGEDNLLVRFSFQDWAREHARPGSIAIARPGGEPASALRITPALAAAMLEDAATSIAEQADLYSRSYDAAVARGVNKLSGPNRAASAQATASNQWSIIGPFGFAPDEAMVITIKAAPNAEYNNLEAADPWLNTFEFVHHQSSLNRSQVRVDGDGYIRYVVSPVDPGVPNWIDTIGQTHGWIWSRWQEVSGELGPEYAARVEIVKRGALRSVLPADTPVVTPAQRKAALAVRAAQLRRRFADADPASPELLRRLDAVERLVGHKLAGVALTANVIE